MASSFETFQKRRLISSYFSVVLSISLVLFLLGLLGLLVLNSQKVGDYFKEQIPLVVFLKDNAKEAEITQLKQSLALADFTKEAIYVTKEQAALKHSATIGEDFMEYLGDNPLQNSIDVRLLAKFVTPQKIEDIVTKLKNKDFVDDVVYDKPLIEKLTDNITKISYWVISVAGVFLIIAILLINSSIRLSVYSKRFTIKTMQMVGATKRFIRLPFILRSLRLGFIGAFLAIIAMGGVVYYSDKSFPDLELLNDKMMLGSLFGFVLLMGLFISWISTYFATQRFLNLKTDELYY
jgi:cell division transport system permease protein|tara:strand:+ start:8900 stop:9778 length:879 start_codon:yes stop_codon:yes gene_type:complete